MRTNLVSIRSKGSKPTDAVVLTCEFRHEHEKDTWLAECIELGTATYASTLDQAQQELGEAVLLQLDEIEQMGFTEEYLKERGVALVPIEPPKPPVRRGSSWSLPVPAGG